MRAAAVLLACACSVSCAGLPRIIPTGAPEAAVLARECLAPFLKGKWRVVHSIQGTLPGGSTADMIGVTIASAETGSIRSTLMSIEGLVLLDAEYDKGLVINRGIGPLGRHDLVTGMMRDIRLMLFAPPGTMTEAGFLADGSGACRYRSDEGDVYVLMKKSRDIELRTYDRSARLLRAVRFLDAGPGGMPRRIELESAGFPGYSLRLDLIEAERLR